MEAVAAMVLLRLELRHAPAARAAAGAAEASTSESVPSTPLLAARPLGFERREAGEEEPVWLPLRRHRHLSWRHRRQM